MEFKPSQVVFCTSDSFPSVEVGESFTVGPDAVYGNQASQHPHIGEALAIAEVNGEFLRFAKYDTPETIAWWHVSRFTTPHGYIDSIRQLLAQRAESVAHLPGKALVCISNEFRLFDMGDNFEVLADSREGRAVERFPELWEALKPAEKRNGMYRFDKYDLPDCQIWWPDYSFRTPEGCLAMLTAHIWETVSALLLAQASIPEPQGK